jgi:hypothetical protein
VLHLIPTDDYIVNLSVGAAGESCFNIGEKEKGERIRSEQFVEAGFSVAHYRFFLTDD